MNAKDMNKVYRVLTSIGFKRTNTFPNSFPLIIILEAEDCKPYAIRLNYHTENVEIYLEITNCGFARIEMLPSEFLSLFEDVATPQELKCAIDGERAIWAALGDNK